MQLFGPENPVGWRFASAVFGTIMVVLAVLVGYRLLRSVAWATLVGLFVAVDGVAVSMSRVAMLDVFLATFALAGVLFVLMDRARSSATNSWNRPWLVAAGLAFGAATAVKGVGVVFLVVFGAYVVVSDLLRLRGGGSAVTVEAGALTALRAFLVAAPAAIAVYCLSWIGMLTTAGFQPGQLAARIVHAYGLDGTISVANNAQSAAWTWPMLLKPSVFLHIRYATPLKDGSMLLTIREVFTLGNPVLWWAGCIAVIAILALVLLRCGGSATTVVLLGLLAGWAPWLFVGNRTIFQYYSVAFVAFIAIALAYILQRLKAWADEKGYGKIYLWTVIAFVAILALEAATFLPLNMGSQITQQDWMSKIWFPAWEYKSGN
jgi:dolichyl-phosphate-mannose--protein O-mannosyl transferase